MRKLHLLQFLVLKQVGNSHERKQSIGTIKRENVKLVPKDVQRILSSHKISEKYNEQQL